MSPEASPSTRQPPPGLVLRAARPQDAKTLAARMSLPGFRWGTARLPFRSPEEERARLEKASSGGRELVALVDGKLVGNASLELRIGRRSHIGRIGMGVHDDWVGRGIGTALMAALVDFADNWLGLLRLELTSTSTTRPPSPLPALRFRDGRNPSRPRSTRWAVRRRLLDGSAQGVAVAVGRSGRPERVGSGDGIHVGRRLIMVGIAPPRTQSSRLVDQRRRYGSARNPLAGPMHMCLVGSDS